MSRNQYSHEAQELYLYALNESSIYNQRESIEANLQRKYDKGIYDRELAAKLWLYWVDNAAKAYHKDFCGNGKWFNLFNIDHRREVATLCEHEHFDLMECRND